jgi:hypothetical protein
MRRNQTLGWIVTICLLSALPVRGQHQRPVGERSGSDVLGKQVAEPESPVASGVPVQGNQAAAQRLVKVSGVLTEFVRNSESSSVEMTFAVYKDEVGGEALWTETQIVEVDKEGRYTALLGAAQANGVPVELFPAGEPRWLGVEVRGQAPQSRTLLVSVPYALKALDAEKLSGKSLSDFVLSESLGEQVRQVIQAQSQSASQSALATAQQKQTGASSATTTQTSSPGPKFPPSRFSGTTSNQIVLVQQNGSGAGLLATSSQNNALYGHSTGGNGVLGVTDSSTGSSGVTGVATSNSTSNNQNGVIGVNAGAGAGVAGIANNATAGVGVYGQAANFAGVFGQTFNPNTNGVAGNANATTGFSIGVSGLSASPNGAGVFGNAVAASGFANGVQGQTSSPFGAGVFGIGATNGQSTGVYGQTVNWVGVGGQALATSGGPAYGVWGDSVSTGGAGVAGFEDATSGYTNGVYGQSVSTDGNGVIGVNNAATGPCNQSFCAGGFGVRGIANGTNGNAYGVLGSTATVGFGAGVLGSADASTGQAFGVFGQANSPNGDAMFGHAASVSGFPTAVVGFLDSQQGGVAGQFVAHGGAGLILQGLSGPNFNQVFSLDASGNLHIVGNLLVDGTKSSTARLQSGQQVALYAVESPENWFEDFGTAELKSGVAWVPLDASFAETTNAATSYHVFLTPNGDSDGLYVARKTAAGFEVREHAGGGSNVAFDYRIVVRRRGYETLRLAEVQHDVKTPESSRRHLAELANSGTLTKAVASRPAGITPARITPPPTVRRVPPRPIDPQLPRLNVPQAR